MERRHVGRVGRSLLAATVVGVLVGAGAVAPADSPRSSPTTSTTSSPASRPLPTVHITVDGGIPDSRKATARMVIRRGGQIGYRGLIGIERRGQSSQRFPKKSWSIELRDRDGDNRDARLLGLPADDDWVLYAPYADKSLMRNTLAYQTVRQFGGNAARTRFVEVRLNGAYHGVYVLTEKIKLHDDRVDLREPAQILEWTSNNQARSKGIDFRLPVTRLPVLFEDPERDDLTRRERRAVRSSIGAAERALYTADSWRRHIDESSAVEYVLVNELFKNQDAFWASVYLSRGAGGRWRLAPVWDFDLSMGNSHTGPSAQLEGAMVAGRAWGERLYQDPAFVAALAQRWRDLREAGLRESLLRRIDLHAQRLTDTGAVDRNFTRWPVLGVNVWPNPPAAPVPTTYVAEVDALRSWLERRIAWLDAHIHEIDKHGVPS